MVSPRTVIIIDKNGSLKTLKIKDYNVDELYKKCGFKKSEGFSLQSNWQVKLDKRYYVELFAKNEGKAGMENKYEFPPPVDTDLFFGSCAIVASEITAFSNNKPIDLTIELWNKMYEKLYGGFEDITTTAKDDEDEEDELDNVSDNLKTKHGGYLKDGFVVDDSNSSSENGEDELEEIHSELSEESYIE